MAALFFMFKILLSLGLLWVFLRYLLFPRLFPNAFSNEEEDVDPE